VPTLSFEITGYTITLGDKLADTFGKTSAKAVGIISCIGVAERVVAYFLSDDSPVPTPMTTSGGKWGLIFLPKEMMPLWVDMLRNEKPLYGNINTDRPEWINVATKIEPVGEKEG
jgi:hypothetical protein